MLRAHSRKEKTMEHQDIWLAIYDWSFATCDFALFWIASEMLDKMLVEGE
jgi:hypothetical protein